jgi:hypothetical protein
MKVVAISKFFVVSANVMNAFQERRSFEKGPSITVVVITPVYLRPGHARNEITNNGFS